MEIILTAIVSSFFGFAIGYTRKIIDIHPVMPTVMHVINAYDTFSESYGDMELSPDRSEATRTAWRDLIKTQANDTDNFHRSMLRIAAVSLYALKRIDDHA